MADFAEDVPVDGPHPELARLVRKLTAGMSSRAAGRRGQVSHDTVVRMWHGGSVGAHTLRRFALGFGIDAGPLLEAAGHAPDTGTSQEPTPGELERIPDLEHLPAPEGWGDLDDYERRMSYESFQNFVRALRRARQQSPGTVTGPVAGDEE